MESECPLLALSGHGLLHCTCLLLGVKRTFSEFAGHTMIALCHGA